MTPRSRDKAMLGRRVLRTVLLFAAVGCSNHEEPRERDLLKLIHERPMVADRVVAAAVTEAHGIEILEKQLEKHPESAKALVEAMLADPALGPMVRERCGAHLASSR